MIQVFLVQLITMFELIIKNKGFFTSPLATTSAPSRCSVITLVVHLTLGGSCGDFNPRWQLR